MTSKELYSKLFPYLKAYLDGEHVQSKIIGSHWLDWDDHTFFANPRQLETTEFRIKKKPREIWVNEYDGDWGCVYDTEETAKKSANTVSLCRQVKFIEVIDDE